MKTQILRSIPDLRQYRAALAPSLRVAFVPTMGALHEGHLSLVKLARERADVVIASIFVNPLQFGPGEDLERYPRPLEEDLALLRESGCDAVFLPDAADMYPQGASTQVIESNLSLLLCGEFRPGHFAGVATVVTKLFNLVQPHVAVFGQKDAQQCAVIERMVRDLNIPVEIVRGPTVRETDGLALSSRNRYLSSEERALAPMILRSLLTAVESLVRGERDLATVESLGRGLLESTGAFKVQYWETRDASTLERLEIFDGTRDALITVAAYLGKTRLIDNIIVPKDLGAHADRPLSHPSELADNPWSQWAELPKHAPAPPTH